jgi:hypothetical protein
MKSLVYLFIATALLLLSAGATQAQQSVKYKTLCRTWMAGIVEIQMHFPIDTTVNVFSRASKVDTLGFTQFRITLNKTGAYTGISAKGEASKGTWELSKNESRLTIRKTTGKKVEYDILRAYPNYLELGIKKFGARTVFKMVPE